MSDLTVDGEGTHNHGDDRRMPGPGRRPWPGEESITDLIVSLHFHSADQNSTTLL